MYVSEYLNGGRIVAHGEITDLTGGFTLEGVVPFSLFVLKKDPSAEDSCLIDVKCYCDDEHSVCPFNAGEWSACSVDSIDASSSPILSTYRLFWGAGCEAKPHIV